MNGAEFFRQLVSRYYRVARRCSDPLLAKRLTLKANELMSKAQAFKPNESIVHSEPRRWSDPK